jgi:hypothetical protein
MYAVSKVKTHPANLPSSQEPPEEELSTLIMAKSIDRTISSAENASNGNTNDKADGFTNGSTKDVKESPPAPTPLPMDRGFAWVQCLGCSCLWFGTWGIANSFGPYLPGMF